jgi:hypothetical protein
MVQAVKAAKLAGAAAGGVTTRAIGDNHRVAFAIGATPPIRRVQKKTAKIVVYAPGEQLAPCSFAAPNGP